jgi:hypothetical protein
MHLISPDEFEIGYRRFELRAHQFLARLHGLNILLAAAGLAVLIVISNRMMLTYPYPMYGISIVMALVRYGILAALPLSLLSLVLPNRAHFHFQFLCLIVIWGTTWHYLFGQIQDPRVRALCAISLPVINGAAWLLLRWRQGGGSWKRGALAFTVFYWTLIALISRSLASEPRHFLIQFWGLKTQFIWITALIWAYRQPLKSENLSIALSPVNALRGALWPRDLRWSGHELSERRTLWWWGVCNLVLAYILLIFRMWAERGPVPHLTPEFSLRSANYFLGILNDVAVFNFLTGSIRLFGYRVQDATNFVLLARTPADIWRRGSVYNYLFVLQYVYMPLLRVTRNRNNFLVTFIAFLVFFVNHQTGFHLHSTLKIVGLQGGSNSNLTFFYQQLIVFLAWFGLIYVSRRYWMFSWKQMEKAHYAWLSIFMTHVTVLSVFFVIWKLFHVVTGGPAT